jgi:hypothetical protein
VRNQSDESISIFPNPSSGLVSVRLPSSHSYQSINVVNYLGEVVAEQKLTGSSAIFDLSHVSNGVYFIQLRGESIFRAHKMILAK